MSILQNLGYEQISSPSSATALTVPNGATRALIITAVQAVRIRDDGTDPTGSVGFLLPVGVPLEYKGDLSAVKLFEDVAGAIVDVLYYA